MSKYLMNLFCIGLHSEFILYMHHFLKNVLIKAPCTGATKQPNQKYRLRILILEVHLKIETRKKEKEEVYFKSRKKIQLYFCGAHQCHHVLFVHFGTPTHVTPFVGSIVTSRNTFQRLFLPS